MTASASSIPPTVQGALWMLLSAIAWTTMVAVARAMSDSLHVFEIVFFRSALALVFFVPWLCRAGLKSLHTTRIAMHLARGGVGLIALYLMFGALALMPLGDVTAITFTRPLFASLAVILLMGEVARARRWITTIIGFCGALIILRPGLEEFSTGQFMALGAALFMVVSSLTVKSLARTDSADCIAMYQVMLFTPLTLIPALFVWQTPGLETFLWLGLMGFGGMVTQRAMTRAYKATDVTVVLPFEYTRLPFAALMGLALFDEFPDIWTWIGGTVIFGATMFMAHREARDVAKTKAAAARGTGGQAR